MQVQFLFIVYGPKKADSFTAYLFMPELNYPARGKGIHIPTLESIFQLLPPLTLTGNPLWLNLEVKDSIDTYGKTVRLQKCNKMLSLDFSRSCI